MRERQKETEKVFEMINNMDGYYGHAYFKKLSKEKESEKEIADLRKQVNNYNWKNNYNRKNMHV